MHLENGVFFWILFAGVDHGMPTVSDVTLANEKNASFTENNYNQEKRELLGASTVDVARILRT